MENPTCEVYPLLWSSDVAAILHWAASTLGLEESWRAPNEQGVIEHAELLWQGGRISINIKTDNTANSGPSGIALRLDDRARVEALYARVEQSSARIIQPLGDTVVAYGFTVLDPDQNQWWVNAESGMLDGLRKIER